MLWSRDVEYFLQLNLEFEFHAQNQNNRFCDDLLIATRGRTVAEAENLVNIELTKIAAWARDNKIQFNEQK